MPHSLMVTMYIQNHDILCKSLGDEIAARSAKTKGGLLHLNRPYNAHIQVKQGVPHDNTQLVR